MSEQDPPESTPEPTPPATPEPTADAKPAPAPSARPLFYGCLSVVLALPFGLAYILLTAAFGLGGGAACAAAIVLGMFLLRRDNKKPIIGALAVGAAIAFVLHGTCLIIIAKST